MKPVNIHENTIDEATTIREVFDDLVYQPRWFEFKSTEIKNIVDIGALIGAFSLWAHEKWPDATIYAYEPDSQSYDYLIKNIKAAKAEKQIHAEKLAVWDSDGLLKFHRFENTPGSNSIVFKNRPFVKGSQETIDVKSRSLSNIIKKIGNIDFLKLDCEGSEYTILYSLNDSDLKKIRCMVLEYHEFDDEQSHKSQTLSNYLRMKGFTTQIIPTDIRTRQGLGYIFASQNNKDKKLQAVFDVNLDSLKNLHHIANKREEYALDLEDSVKRKEIELENIQNRFAEKEKYAKELEGVVGEKEKYAKELEGVVGEKEKYAKELGIKIKLKDDELIKLENFITEGENEISQLFEIISSKDFELIEFKNKLSEIESSILFQIIRKTSKKIDSSFPNNSRRGEFKKIVSASLLIIFSRGMKKYLSEVEIKLKRKEFKVLTPVVISEKEEVKLKKTVENNKKNRLKVNPHGKNTIKNDEILISSEENLM